MYTHIHMYAHITHVHRSVLTSQDQFQCCAVLIHYIDTTTVTVLANSADSVIHSVMVHAQERCVLWVCCVHLHYTLFILLHVLLYSGTLQLQYVCELKFVCESLQCY